MHLTTRLHHDNFSYRALLSIVLVLLGLVVLLIRLGHKPITAKAAWFDDTWTFRKSYTYTNGGAAVTYQKIKLDIDTATLITNLQLQSDCGDARFTDNFGNLLEYYIDTAVGACNTASTDFYVLLPAIPANPFYIYYYYGNETANNGTNSQQFTQSTFTPGSTNIGTEEIEVGPIAYWRFNENVGNTSFNALPAVTSSVQLLGGAELRPTNQCVEGRCVKFDGTNAYLDMGDINFYSSNQTISSWFKTNNATPAARTILGGSEGATNNRLFTLEMLSTGEVRFTYDSNPGGGGVTNLDSGQTFYDARWHHFVATKSGTTMSLYIDGRLMGTATEPTYTGVIRVYAGVRDLSGLARDYDGFLDTTKIYMYARSADQIKTDYNAGYAPKGNNTNFGIGTTQLDTVDPVLYYDFEEGTGTTTFDVGGTTFQNGGIATATFDNGKYGKALSFSGSGSVQSADTAVLSLTGNLSLSAWVYPTSNANQTIIDKRNSSQRSGYGLELNSSGNLIGNVASAATNATVTSTSTIPLNTWSNVQLTYDGSNLKLYINGILDTTTASATNPADGTGVFMVGMRGDSTQSFNGLIDQVKVYNYARTVRQVQEELNNNLPQRQPLIYYHFDESVGTTTYNSLSSSYFATQSNMASPATTTSGWTKSGQYNSALLFDGTNDLVNISGESAIRFNGSTEDFSISAWVKRTSVGSTQYIISKEDADNDGWRLMFDAGDTVTCSVNATDITSTVTITDTTLWHHLVCAVDRSGTSYIYIDGSLASAGTSTTALTMATTTSAAMGGRSYTTGAYLAGGLDDLKIFNVALSATEVKIEYNRSSAIQISSLSTDSGGSAPSTSFSRLYCVPGDTSSCSPPVLHLTLDEGVGTSAYDIGGSAYNGRLGTGSSSPTRSPGVLGQAMSFDGNDNINVGQRTGLQFNYNNSFSFSAWINTPSLPPGGNYPYPLIQTGPDSSGGRFQYGIVLDGDTTGKLCTTVSIPLTGSREACVSSAIATNTWYHVTGVFDTSYIYLYVNGQYITKTSYTLGTPSAASGDFMIGSSNSNFYYTGLIDDVRVYNYARTPSQIAWEYNQGKPMTYFKLDECQNSTVFDSIGTGITGTIVLSTTGTQTNALGMGTCTLNAATPRYNGAIGRVNSSVNLDGTSDYIQVNDSTALRFDSTNENFSIFAWVKRASNGTMYIFSKEDADNDGWRLQFDAGNTVTCSVNSTDITSGSTITDTLWHHIGCTVNRSGSGQVYIDGKADGSSTSTSALTMATTTNLLLGARSYTTTNYLAGQLDDVQIFSYPLTAQQVELLYNQSGVIRFAPISGTP